MWLLQEKNKIIWHLYYISHNNKSKVCESLSFTEAKHILKIVDLFIRLLPNFKKEALSFIESTGIVVNAKSKEII